VIRLAACLLVFAVFAVFAVLAGPVRAETLPPTITAVKNEIREAFDQFRRAVLRGDRGTVAKMVTGEAVQYGNALLRMARIWDRDRLATQSAVTQIAVLGLRLDTDPGELDDMLPAEAFARTYEAGVLDPLVFEEMKLVQIDLGSGRTTARALIGIGEQRGDAPIAFAKIDERWRIDPVSISNQISLSLTVLLERQGVSEEAYVVDFMNQMYGDMFNDRAWEPAKTSTGPASE